MFRKIISIILIAVMTAGCAVPKMEQKKETAKKPATKKATKKAE